MGFFTLLCLCLVTLIFPPIGVWFVAGCGSDLFLNILFTLFGYFPGHIHAFYIIFVYYSRRSDRKHGIPLGTDAVFIFSRKVQNGGYGDYVVRPGYR